MFHFDTTFDIVRLRREELIDATRSRPRTIRNRLRRDRPPVERQRLVA